MKEVVITQENFENEVLNSDIPVLIDFWASWCGPCRMLSPIVAEIAEEYEGKIKVGKVNVDEQHSLAAAFSVSSIPMLVLMKEKKAVAAFVGYKTKDQIVAAFKL